MKCAVVVSEFDPFHTGHRYLIDTLKDQLGEDVAVVSVMSGNYTERGALAVTDKYRRARAAVLSGVDLVLELPFPFCAASAEVFAKSAVSIAAGLGIPDTTLVFGAECPDADLLGRVAEYTLTDGFSDAVRALTDKSPEIGYPAAAERVLRQAFDLPDGFFSPNDILAVSYIAAIREKDLTLKFLPIGRVGTGFRDEVAKGAFPSSSSLRAALLSSGGMPDGLTEGSALVLAEARADGALFPDPEKLFPLVRDKLLDKTPPDEELSFDCRGGLYTRLCRIAREAENLSDLIKRTETKKFTRARIRRAVLHTAFGVTSSDIGQEPAYTTVLALGEIGGRLLASVRRSATIRILTKPSAIPDGPAAKQKALADRADIAYLLCLPKPRPSADLYRSGPFVREK